MHHTTAEEGKHPRNEISEQKIEGENAARLVRQVVAQVISPRCEIRTRCESQLALFGDTQVNWAVLVTRHFSMRTQRVT